MICLQKEPEFERKSGSFCVLCRDNKVVKNNENVKREQYAPFLYNAMGIDKGNDNGTGSSAVNPCEPPVVEPPKPPLTDEGNTGDDGSNGESVATNEG
ncbi:MULTISPECIES: hypothetical protein [Bacillus]|nr:MULTISPECIES: hypothetical protein [Bacillus]